MATKKEEQGFTTKPVKIDDIIKKAIFISMAIKTNIIDRIYFIFLCNCVKIIYF